MALNRAAVRRDLPYLRRRVKPVSVDVAAAVVAAAPSAPSTPSASGGLSLRPAIAAAPATAPAAAPATPPATSGGLSLRPAAASTPTAKPAAASGSRPTSAAAPSGARPADPTRPARPTLPQPFPAPAIDEVRELGPEHPVLRLDARRSAIGSLIVSGVHAIAWESTNLVTGALTLTSGGVDTAGTPVMTPGNRALVGFDDGDAIVALRHLRTLRRALFIGNGPEPIGVQLFDGSHVTVAVTVASDPGAGAASGDRMFVLTLLRIGALIELRAEPVARALSPAELHREFGFQLTARFDARQPRTR
ncbi:hypothetical protein B7R22_01200 [Subtercola boreus]|uniref:Uncharacterized protein n=1 Tax=Subtercola boreus TaxID=120213 RepID=A0A3E0W5Z1_9MICO|nr:hypothetical protein [Subtercola boreus]RFA16953.1 hypothetical protein B7R22_01200 [Subtercola boreus]